MMQTCHPRRSFAKPCEASRSASPPSGLTRGRDVPEHVRLRRQHRPLVAAPGGAMSTFAAKPSHRPLMAASGGAMCMSRTDTVSSSLEPPPEDASEISDLHGSQGSC